MVGYNGLCVVRERIEHLKFAKIRKKDTRHYILKYNTVKSLNIIGVDETNIERYVDKILTKVYEEVN
jgi:recombinational DNA repair protein RecR